MKKLLVSSLVLVSLVFGSCSTSTGPGGGTIFGYLKPGSRLDFLHTERDSAGAIINQYTDAMLVLATNIVFDGRTGVVQVLEKYPYGDTTYYVMDASGNVAYRGADPRYTYPFDWITIPCGTQQPMTLRYDTTVQGAPAYEIINMTGGGSGFLSLDSGVLATKRVKFDIELSAMDNGRVQTIHPTMTMDVAPTIGLVVQTDRPSYVEDGHHTDAEHLQLISIEY